MYPDRYLSRSPPRCPSRSTRAQRRVGSRARLAFAACLQGNVALQRLVNRGVERSETGFVDFTSFYCRRLVAALERVGGPEVDLEIWLLPRASFIAASGGWVTVASGSTSNHGIACVLAEHNLQCYEYDAADISYNTCLADQGWPAWWKCGFSFAS